MCLLVVNAISSEKPGAYSIKTDTAPPTVWRAMGPSPGLRKAMGSVWPSLWWKFAAQLCLRNIFYYRVVFSISVSSNNIDYRGKSLTRSSKEFFLIKLIIPHGANYSTKILNNGSRNWVVSQSFTKNAKVEIFAKWGKYAQARLVYWTVFLEALKSFQKKKASQNKNFFYVYCQ